MYIVIDAPRWRIAEQPPIVHPVTAVTISGDLITVEGGTAYFHAREVEISFVPDCWKDYAHNRRKDLMVAV